MLTYLAWRFGSTWRGNVYGGESDAPDGRVTDWSGPSDVGRFRLHRSRLHRFRLRRLDFPTFPTLPKFLFPFFPILHIFLDLRLLLIGKICRNRGW